MQSCKKRASRCNRRFSLMWEMWHTHTENQMDGKFDLFKVYEIGLDQSSMGEVACFSCNLGKRGNLSSIIFLIYSRNIGMQVIRFVWIRFWDFTTHTKKLFRSAPTIVSITEKLHFSVYHTSMAAAAMRVIVAPWDRFRAIKFCYQLC